MRNAILVGAALLFLILGIIARYLPNKYTLETCRVTQQQSAKVILVHGLIHYDSLHILSYDIQDRLKFTAEYVDKNSVALFIDPLEKKLPEFLIFYGVKKTFAFQEKINLEYFKTYFDYFRTYDRYFYFHFSILGGVALLFAISLLVSQIAQIPLLKDFNLITFSALILLALENYYLKINTYISWVGLSNVVLWILMMVSQGVIKYYHKQRPSISIGNIWSTTDLSLGLLVCVCFAFFPILREMHLIIQALILILLAFNYNAILQFNVHISRAFKIINWVGLPIFLGQWLQVFYDVTSEDFKIIIAYMLLSFLVVLAVLIARYILIEFRKSSEISAINVRLRREIGQREFASIENERRRLVDELHGDVLNRVHMLKLQLSHVPNENNGFDLQVQHHVQETLQSLRKYSYSLYPPYVEQLSLSDILKREIEGFDMDPINRFQLLLPIESKNTITAILKVWIYRVFKEFVLFYGLDKTDNFVVIFLDNEDESKIRFTLKYRIWQSQSPVFKSLNESNVRTYLDYLSAEFNWVLNEEYQGWTFTFDRSAVI
jgi:signal transduction histidine kinase